jgi:hypothetical protein
MRFVTAVILAVASALFIGEVRAATAVSKNDEARGTTTQHLRFENGRLEQLVRKSLDDSKTLRTLLERVEASDLVVYVRCDPRLDGALSGHMSFLTRAGNTRFLLIRVRYLGSRLTQVALVGHELRHAVEVADTPAIVDLASFDQEYGRLGYVNVNGSRNGVVVYETEEAERTGEQILRELRQGTD